jgi:glycogen debranching enzyme
MTALQPLLEAETVILRAPAQVWSSPSGAIGERPIHGAYLSDTRFLSHLAIRFDGRAAETIATDRRGADSVDFVGVLRHLDDGGADPRVRVRERRTVTIDGLEESVTVTSGLGHPVSIAVQVRIRADLARMDDIKSGAPTALTGIRRDAGAAAWGDGGVTARLVSDARLSVDGAGLELAWTLEVPANGERTVSWQIAAQDAHTVVGPAVTPPDWAWPDATGDPFLDAWLDQAADDLAALRMSTVAQPEFTFLAAGAPWFFTLFGRDSLWAAKFLAPLGGSLAADTLRVLASMQGTRVDSISAEQPGKIPHELRRYTQRLGPGAVTLPPLYYGTIDATALWITLLCDAADLGMPEPEVRALLPNLNAALAWLRDYGDEDGDGLLEYVNRDSNGLSNQGWKDSGDSVQWADGSLATAPIALCEVQAYAYEAATRGADLLERLGMPGTEWRHWAERLRERFAESFWVDDPAGAYPAIALDADKRPVDSLTSNIGHLLGTGLLDAGQSALVAARLVSPELSSGFGLRTMSTAAAGYWPLSYHGGSVWAHDTAIAIRGLVRAGFPAEALQLCDGLIAAASSFGFRMPELHSGDASVDLARAVPYPAACRPQAWSAAAAVVVFSARQEIGERTS